MGQIYVDVAAAQAEMGIMMLDSSTSGGGQEGGYWLYWNEKGYTGISWYWGEANNYIQTGWPAYVNDGKLTCGVQHTPDESGLKEHISGGHADNLNDVLAPWPDGQKMQFVGYHYDEFFGVGCLADA